MTQQITYTVRDESGYRVQITADSALSAAAEYVTSGDFANSSTGYVDVTVDWENDEDTFRVAIPNWAGCAAE